MDSDIQIAQNNQSLPIEDIAKACGLKPEEILPYGHDKAKISHEGLMRLQSHPRGHLILVTAINPTPAGEGKSTVTIGLGDALHRLNKKVMITLREPSLGPTMGLKGGAAGGGYAQVVPMEDINLHFTGDIHAITATNNLLAALIDNHIQQGNELGIDSRRIIWKRCIDMNDRVLRHVVLGLGTPGNGYVREDGFDITVASEIMAVLCLSRDLEEMTDRFNQMIVAYRRDKTPIRVQDLGCAGAMSLLMKDAILPNLVQTLEHTPALIHGGPFANIAHGCNSVIATDAALRLSDYVVTEAGFGADLGAEKFMDIKVPVLGHHPEAVVIVATIRALKHHGKGDDFAALECGISNLKHHIVTMQKYGVPVVVAVNRFIQDTEEELTFVHQTCQSLGVSCHTTEVWAKGGEGALSLAEDVLHQIHHAHPHFTPLYSAEETSIEDKLDCLVKEIYGGNQIEYSPQALNELKEIKANGWDKLPLCMAKTQYALSDNPKDLGEPRDFTLHIRQFIPKLGAGFIVCLTGNILTMPGLPKHPAALNMSIDNRGKIEGLF
ncbi:formate--tetrahydrofolate ligase [Aerococcus christensenii]|uniref:formate--tetrahydrofolate ligase n=1 Tax=Aerococcus christensenii TaxID=87541 RepID=UPI0023A9E73C|nr:formate--tetrahydrofolate ligase [Aerococcus christensenii]WEB71654.1 formate--tetrahydrofolate ligase [Aerococcus christensenii]